MASSINVNQNNNIVSLQDQNRKITITDNVQEKTVSITQPITNIVSVNSLGPQGTEGPVGPTGELTSHTNLSITGSLYVSGTSAGHITASGNISASGDIAGNNISATDVISISFTGSIDNPALRFGPLTGNLAGNKVGIMLDELVPGSTFFVPYFVANGAKMFGFGGTMDMQVPIQMNSSKLSFDTDVINTYIAADAETPENLEIHADGNIELRAQDDLQVYSNIDITGNITASGNISGSGTGSLGYLMLPNIPSSDPGVVGAVWREGTDLKVSVG